MVPTKGNRKWLLTWEVINGKQQGFCGRLLYLFQWIPQHGRVLNKNLEKFRERNLLESKMYTRKAFTIHILLHTILHHGIIFNTQFLLTLCLLLLQHVLKVLASESFTSEQTFEWDYRVVQKKPLEIGINVGQPHFLERCVCQSYNFRLGC